MRICKRCGIEKDEKEFPLHKLYIRYVCRDCEKPNSGRKKKGCKPPVPFKKGRTPWNKGSKMSDEVKRKCGLKNIGRKLTEEHKAKLSKIMRGRGKSRLSCKYTDWRNGIFEKCGYKCSECNCEEKEKLHAHHLVPWRENEKLRFDVNNGKVLCRVCHAKLEGFKKGHLGGQPFRKGQKSWNKGKKFPGQINSGSFKKGPGWNNGIYTSPEKSRRCKTCGVEKKIDEFPIQEKYRRWYCKRCWNLRCKQHK